MNKIYILDTNVLLHDPLSLNAFEDNEVVIPLVVLDELDTKKQGLDETAKHARMAIRSLDKLRLKGSIHEGVETLSKGKLRVELNHMDKCPADLDPNRVDNRLISVALGIMEDEIRGLQRRVTLITKDINLRVKCDALGVPTADYNADSVAENPNSIYEGVAEVDVESELVDAFHSEGFIDAAGLGEFHPNQYVNIRSNINSKHSGLAKFKNNALVKIHTFDNVWGISSRNREQAFSLDALFDPDIKLVTMIGKAGSGKAQPLDSKILTPSGWKNMGSINIGDIVCTPDGKTARVNGVFPQGKKRIFRVNFTDGTSAECCDDHLWHTRTSLDRNSNRNGSIKSLKNIRESLKYGSKRNHSIPITEPVFFEDKDLPIDPYILGLLLGDGSLTSITPSITTNDDEILKKFGEYAAKNGLQLVRKNDGISYYISKEYQSDGRRHPSQTKNVLGESLKRLGLIGITSHTKFIPEIYKFSSVRNRINLLKGLMDADGCVCGKFIEFTSVSQNLTNDVAFLIQSLGGTAKINRKKTKWEHKGTINFSSAFRISVCLPNNINPFNLDRKSSAVQDRVKYFPRRYIDNVEYIGEKEAQCIHIDSEDHLYITNDFIITHNTLMAAASGISQLLDSHVYKKLIMTRPVQPLGRDIGFLPGDMNEKMKPWMAPLQDNLDLLFSGKGSNYLDMQRDAGLIEVEALTYIRGRSIPRSFIIVDEAQNLTLHEIKTIITRVGEGSKVVLTGDIMQIDNPFIDSVDNGLSCVIEKFKHLPIAAHITLQKGERSELASLAAEIL